MTEKIIGILVIVFAWWTPMYTNWILTILGVILIWHAFRCTNCAVPQAGAMKKPMPAKPVKKSVKKKK
tara:strand:- start:654 stop:857 length:204 start_codon:yes stop_codon:yes gene_type:complete